MQNAVEHGAAGAIRLSVSRREQQLDMVVADDGAGLPADFNLEQAQGLGPADRAHARGRARCAERSPSARRPRRHRGGGGDTGDQNGAVS